ncbi:C1 family peptidase [Chryseobacterium potabilaquae]|uniref:Peptidase C1A papain C-terminal domain-containing protein n=1 Tax=Chryseobacterium potabilaquae TaxID=2675057 RepID=A0A6N4X4B4_9FLAO|nr:C1 family peptidase [Chryseobacterium potabilaquae]CAA7194072.1 hypothetical protein CHRY9293_00452 [Chryseobacterium potabilaquae]
MKKTIFLAITGLVMATVTSCNQDRDESQGSLSMNPGKQYNESTSRGASNSVDGNALLRQYGSPTRANYTIPYLPSAGNQGTDQSCVAWSTTYAAATILERNFINSNASPRSPRYVYNQINNGSCTTTPGIINGLNTLVSSGACSIEEMPYVQGQCSFAPSQFQRNLASSHKLTKWATVDNTNLQQVKTLLANNFPLIISVPMNSSFGLISASTGWAVTSCESFNAFATPMHAVCVVGYDDNRRAFKVMNSFGNNFADNGFFWISYDLFTQRRSSLGQGSPVNECYTAEVKDGTLPTF